VSGDIIEIIDITIYDDRMASIEKLSMSSITIRNLEPGLKERLRVRAAQHGHSMEAEARHILTGALKGSERKSASLYERIRARVEPVGGIDLDLPPRDPAREPPRFD
jgi:plasmid stability protein